MDEEAATESPIEAAVGSPGDDVTTAFELLGNETRLAILLALWDALEPFGDQRVSPLTFSELQDRVGVRDSGQFNYHLEKLVGTFLRDADDGYVLNGAGHSIVEAVIAGAGIEDATLQPAEVDIDCPYCGSPTAVGYQNELLYQICTNCEGDHEQRGPLADVGEAYGGLLFVAVTDPAALGSRTPREVFQASVIKATLRTAMQMAGVCSRCTGTVRSRLHFCDDHVGSGDEICPNCGHRWGFRPLFTCTVCKYESVPAPAFPAAFHPALIAFYADHGIEIGNLIDPESIVRIESLLREQEAELVSTDPPRVRVTVRHDDDEIQLTYDESVHFIDVSRSGSTGAAADGLG